VKMHHVVVVVACALNVAMSLIKMWHVDVHFKRKTKRFSLKGEKQ